MRDRGDQGVPRTIRQVPGLQLRAGPPHQRDEQSDHGGQDRDLLAESDAFGVKIEFAPIELLQGLKLPRFRGQFLLCRNSYCLRPQFKFNRAEISNV